MASDKSLLRGPSLTLNGAEYLSAPVRQINALAYLTPFDPSDLTLKRSKGVVDETLVSPFGANPRRNLILGFHIKDMSSNLRGRKLGESLIKQGIQRGAYQTLPRRSLFPRGARHTS